MRIGSLFSGIGGLELGLEWAGVGHTVFQVEQDPYCLAVLAKHWPDAQRFTDVREVGAHNLPAVDVLCGGFPCQDISYAGKGAGLSGARSGLWYEYARIVREMGPRYVVVENVAALLTRGLDAVLGTLADLGYDAEWSCLTAADVGAPHRRERVFIIAYAERDAVRVIAERDQSHAAECGDAEPRHDGAAQSLANASRGGKPNIACIPNSEALVSALAGPGRGTARGHIAAGISLDRRADPGRAQDVADTDGGRLEVCVQLYGTAEQDSTDRDSRRRHADGRSGADWWATEPDVGRVADGVPARVDRLRALGNAVVPQVAEVVGRRLMQLAAEGV